MKFDYNTLKSMVGKGSLGKWKGKPVYTCSKNDLRERSYGNFYILYDDENKIVIKHEEDNNFYCYGTVNQLGTVNEYDNLIFYGDKNGEVKFQREKVAEQGVPVIGDVKLGIDVEGTLKKAREMSIDDLLKGFNYGLEK